MGLTDELKQKTAAQPPENLTGRQQVLLEKDEIKAALSAGFTKKEIWQHLHEKGQVTVGYSPFMRLLKSLGIEQNEVIPQPPVEAKAAEPPAMAEEIIEKGRENPILAKLRQAKEAAKKQKQQNSYNPVPRDDVI